MGNKEKVSEFLTLDISKPLIQKNLDEGLIERAGYGLYMGNKILKDEYFVVQKMSTSNIFL